MNISTTILSKTIDLDLPFNFSCREYQKPFFRAMKDGKKRAFLCWHRRAGKDKVCWNYLIMQAARKIGVYNYYAPSYRQGKRIIWENIDGNGFKMLKHIPDQLLDGKPNETELKIRLKNGSLIQILGTEDHDTLVGANPIGCVFTEYSLQHPQVWELIRPILKENGGWAIFNGTPRGENHFKDMLEMAKKNSETWYWEVLTNDHTCVLSKEDIDRERDEGMSEDMIQQEYFCSFTLGIQGNYYGKYVSEAREENRIGKIPWDRQARVYTAWDIGVGDSTSIIFYQLIGQEVHIIDYYEASGEGLPHYAGVLFGKPYIYADHYAPHDIEQRSFQSGISHRAVARDLGINFITLPTLQRSVDEGIEALRGIFPRIWVDSEKAKRLIKCLENYRKEYDEKLQVYKSRPRHDWASHGADAARYMAIAIKIHHDKSDGISDSEADRLRDKYQPIFKK